ncbi:Transcription initiation factor TFIID subunit 9 [Coniosporium tulheliwenetii]|uniref:Transcription initiation factor TFIID subunit 9 n=1 Tax=Coniosporium tulheliwenetii TaxID=3383036 RepID=A0ACC2ZGA3_9PEZI|nr:Transcription initiation factor TFIID subunit 9 [Cladosporium sp. JES 115]
MQLYRSGSNINRRIRDLLRTKLLHAALLFAVAQPPKSLPIAVESLQATATASNPTPATLTADAPTSQPTSQPSVPVPPTSTTDTGLSKRPRDARLIHLVLAAQGVTAYQERVPLQLLDFAYRYTSGVLSDALAVSAEAAPTMRGEHARGGGCAGGECESCGCEARDRESAQCAVWGQLPREFMNEIAAERNRIALPRVEREFGVRLPDEKYCFTGVGWGLKEEWDSEVEEEEGDGGLGDGYCYEG